MSSGNGKNATHLILNMCVCSSKTIPERNKGHEEENIKRNMNKISNGMCKPYAKIQWRRRCMQKSNRNV